MQPQCMCVSVQGSAGLPKGRIDKHYKEGVMFITYSLLIASLKKALLQTVDDQNIDTSNGAGSDLPDPRAQGVLPGTRLFHVVEWLAGRDRQGNCLIILDECHKAKNLIAKEGDRIQPLSCCNLGLDWMHCKWVWEDARHGTCHASSKPLGSNRLSLYGTAHVACLRWLEAGLAVCGLMWVSSRAML